MEKSLEDFSTEELRKEIEKRGYEQEKIESMPKPLENPDFSFLSEQCKAHILEMTSIDYCEDNCSDNAHYIYEAAMQAVYGKDIWTWINKQTL